MRLVASANSVPPRGARSRGSDAGLRGNSPRTQGHAEAQCTRELVAAAPELLGRLGAPFGAQRGRLTQSGTPPASRRFPRVAPILHNARLDLEGMVASEQAVRVEYDMAIVRGFALSALIFSQELGGL